MGRVFVAGSINMDVVATAVRHPKVGETVAGDAVHYFPGGKGANQAVAAAKLGAPTTLIGRLGADAFGQQLRTFLTAQGVDLAFVKDTAGAHTGTAIITIARCRQHHRGGARRQCAGDARGCRRTLAGQGRYRGQPVRDPVAHDICIFQARAGGWCDHDPQSRTGDHVRPGVARSRRYPDRERDRVGVSHKHRTSSH